MKKKQSDFIAFRSEELSRRLKVFQKENPGTSISDIIRAAVSEKLDRITQGEDDGIRLHSPERRKGSAHAGPTSDRAGRSR